MYFIHCKFIWKLETSQMSRNIEWFKYIMVYLYKEVVWAH